MRTTKGLLRSETSRSKYSRHANSQLTGFEAPQKRRLAMQSKDAPTMSTLMPTCRQ
jgi:hypothetical protein